MTSAFFRASLCLSRSAKYRHLIVKGILIWACIHGCTAYVHVCSGLNYTSMLTSSGWYWSTSGLRIESCDLCLLTPDTSIMILGTHLLFFQVHVGSTVREVVEVSYVHPRVAGRAGGNPVEIASAAVVGNPIRTIKLHSLPSLHDAETGSQQGAKTLVETLGLLLASAPSGVAGCSPARKQEQPWRRSASCGLKAPSSPGRP